MVYDKAVNLTAFPFQFNVYNFGDEILDGIIFDDEEPNNLQWIFLCYNGF